MAKLSIIVLQYNRSDLTLACLEALRQLPLAPPLKFKRGSEGVDVIVVDNGSEIKHLKNVEYWIQLHTAHGYKLIANSWNAGYSGGNNAGIEYALEHGADRVLILNNDVILHEMLTGDADIVGLEQGRVFGFDYLSGAALLVKREVFEKIGLFDERYFLYYEDVDFCMRAQKAGFTLGLSKAKFTHAISATTSSLGAADLLYYHTRNALLLNTTHGPWWMKALLPIWQWWIIVKQKMKIAVGDHVDESKAILQGVIDYQNKRFSIR